MMEFDKIKSSLKRYNELKQILEIDHGSPDHAVPIQIPLPKQLAAPSTSHWLLDLHSNLL